MGKSFLPLLFFLLCGCATTPGLPFRTELTPHEISGRLKWEESPVADAREAERFISSRIESIEDLIAPNIDPYKGADSMPAICQRQNLPAVFRSAAEGSRAVFASFYSSPNHVLGLCADPNQVVKTQYLLLYCGGERIYTVRYFYAKDEPWLKQPVAHCRRRPD